MIGLMLSEKEDRLLVAFRLNIQQEPDNKARMIGLLLNVFVNF